MSSAADSGWPGGDRADTAMCTALEVTVTAQTSDEIGFKVLPSALEELQVDLASPTSQQLAAWGRSLGMAPGAMEAWALVTTRPVAMAACYGVATTIQIISTIVVQIVATPSGLRVQIPAAANAALNLTLFVLYWRSGPRHHKAAFVNVMNVLFIGSAIYLWLPVCAVADV
jgi:hypothetical protein